MSDEKKSDYILATGENIKKLLIEERSAKMIDYLKYDDAIRQINQKEENA